MSSVGVSQRAKAMVLIRCSRRAYALLFPHKVAVKDMLEAYLDCVVDFTREDPLLVNWVPLQSIVSLGNNALDILLSLNGVDLSEQLFSRLEEVVSILRKKDSFPSQVKMLLARPIRVVLVSGSSTKTLVFAAK